MDNIDNKTILIAGGTGSWARGLINELLKTEVSSIKVMARSESQMVLMKRIYSDSRIVYCIGDIRDYQRLMQICRGCDIIFHLAALKHVPICEVTPYEAIQTNVAGTQNIIDCAIAAGVEKVIYTSTDKAVVPECTYGCTKLLGEKMILAANSKTMSTRFMVFRSGNLLRSSGSVVPLFQNQIREMNRIKLTDRRMNRFFISIQDASQLLIECAVRGMGGEIFLPVMPSIQIYHLAKYMLEQYGLEEDAIHISGLRPGEKLYEQMATDEECRHIYRVNDKLCVILKEDSHGWISNCFINKEDLYCCDSKAAVVEYEEAAMFLESKDILGGCAV